MHRSRKITFSQTSLNIMSLIYLQRQICAGFWCWWNAADLRRISGFSVTLWSCLNFPEQISQISDNRRYIIYRKCTRLKEENSGEQDGSFQSSKRLLLSLLNKMKMVEVGIGGFESRIRVPHDFPCEQGPQIRLLRASERFPLPQCGK